MESRSTYSVSRNKRTDCWRENADLQSAGRARLGVWQKCITLLIAFVTAHSACAQQAKSPSPSPLGEELQVCAGCPTFVKVPKAPADIRRIEYVAKYPLTWREYLISVDDGACRPPSQVFQISGRSYSAEKYLDQLKIDWPISILNQDEIECFRRWLDNKTAYAVELPSDREWEWFALAGRTGSRFPWGDNTEDPPAAVKGVKIATENVLTGLRDQAGVFLVRGVRVGLFPPNRWGLYDLIGNEYELTSNIYSGEEWYRMHPHPANSGAMINYGVALVKGGHAGLDLERIGSVYQSDSIRIMDGRFSSNVSLRFILVMGGDDE